MYPYIQCIWCHRLFVTDNNREGLTSYTCSCLWIYGNASSSIMNAFTGHFPWNISRKMQLLDKEVDRRGLEAPTGWDDLESRSRGPTFEVVWELNQKNLCTKFRHRSLTRCRDMLYTRKCDERTVSRSKSRSRWPTMLTHPEIQPKESPYQILPS